MKLTYEKDGGIAYFPALYKPISIDTTQIDQKIALQLESLVKDSSLFKYPGYISSVSKGAADYFTHKITVEDDQGIHVVQITEPITDQNLQKLISFIQNKVTFF